MPLNLVQSTLVSDPPQQPPGISNLHSFEFSRVFEDEVISCCKSVTSNTIGFDQIHSKFIRLLLPKISLTYLTPSLLPASFLTVVNMLRSFPCPNHQMSIAPYLYFHLYLKYWNDCYTTKLVLI